MKGLRRLDIYARAAKSAYAHERTEVGKMVSFCTNAVITVPVLSSVIKHRLYGFHLSFIFSGQ
jgi:hypothetical protein